MPTAKETSTWLRKAARGPARAASARFLTSTKKHQPLKQVWRTTGKDWPGNDSGRMYVQRLMPDGSWSAPIYVPDEPVNNDLLL